MVTLGLALLCIALFVIIARRLQAQRAAELNADEHRTAAETLRRELSALQAGAQAQRAQLDSELKRGEQLEQSLRTQGVEAERKTDELRREASASHERLHAALTQAASCTAGLEQQVADLQQRAAELGQVRSELKQTVEALTASLAERARLETQLEEQKRSADEQRRAQGDLDKQLEDKFKGLAAQMLEQNSEKFATTTKQRLDEMAEGLRSHVKELREKVEQTHLTDTSDRVALRTELSRMLTATKQIDQGAVNLTRALTGDRRAQGVWGELTLERILEQSGLRDGIEYQRQLTVSDDDGRRLRPDIVVNLPGGRSVVVDAKVSLTAYYDYTGANDDAETADALSRHLISVRTHIKQLADKGYWRANALSGGDYVVMFVAIESAMAQALRSEPGLFEEAFRDHVIITSPSTLLATLRTIEHTWSVERQNETARTIVAEAGKLYDKFEAFVDDLKNVGNRLQQAQKAYDEAFGKLSTGSGNLVRRADKLRSLGAKVKKSLPKELVDGAVAGMLAEASAHAESEAPHVQTD